MGFNSALGLLEGEEKVERGIKKKSLDANLALVFLGPAKGFSDEKVDR